MKNWIKENQFLEIGMLLVVIAIGFFGGCQVTAPSLLNPTRKITRAELEIELQQLLSKAEMRFKEIDQKEKFKRELLNHALLISQSGNVNLLGLIPIAISLLGAGAVADNVKKRKIIRDNLTTYVKTVKENSGSAGDTA